MNYTITLILQFFCFIKFKLYLINYNLIIIVIINSKM